MMDLGINGGHLRINDDGSTQASKEVLKEINDNYQIPDGKDNNDKPSILETEG